ncbi:putative plant-specific domain TIGR01568 family protein [Hordeum vulgare]|uniref:Transcription repressor n=1 Tax=Hordeum vulgare subsp. vulgare TaxID=112509 RepID=A0A8I7B107_HORVV|nr:transcription repressor OFP8-like [Hordeum vulgare subsp. vulgare]KAE8773476.1 putative plant-specific domain TIGR01568 family protein [Hordeum vulgare]KAI5017594.1 hypothetical protein ZWY2020_042482 [Hordeum vulgare]
MKAMILRRRGAGGGLRIPRKGRGFMCGCGGSKAVSVSDGSDKQSPMATPPTNTSTATTATTTMSTVATTATRRAGNSRTASLISTAAASSSFSHSSTDEADTSVGSTPSVAALLRQLAELERTVRSLQGEAADDGRRHRRTTSEGGGRRVEESVAVVKESADPLADFRRSMLQMIVEKEIVGGADLRELLHRFLSLNSPHHHHLIIRAFAEIWEEVFSGYERTPDFLVSNSHGRKRLPAANSLHGTVRC